MLSSNSDMVFHRPFSGEDCIPRIHRRWPNWLSDISKCDQLLMRLTERPRTKPLRYVPASLSVDPNEHAVFPFEMMEQLVQKVHVIALVDCPCRVTEQLIGEKKCDHPLETCIKYDESAEHLIEKGIGKEITKQEALDVIRRSEEAGLVHLVDNAREQD